ncbi:DUF4422 domain-containing protein [uncultured Methanobrevibacter sp.]|uniref:DUF4422 domain-containing protein n=1 Tax=uncultured Methanobrevibacter sp. TaxID=253161 RepID=UPI0025EB5740|nr:DUF4422 domain-containing protein [uncultured Methanobrevibacter sp.]
MEQNIKMYILTHKKFDESYDEQIYLPLLCGSKLLDEDFGYVTDQTGDNISELNPFFSELTGQYWVWKNTNQDIVGFCHYRRFFSKNLLFNKKLDKKEIEKTLHKYDIILPSPYNFVRTTQKQHFLTWLKNKFPIEKFLDITGDIIKTETPEYYDAYKNALDDTFFYHKNMFVCNQEIANDYFNWCFKILNNLCKKTQMVDNNEYRVLGYIGEILLDVYVKKNKLKVKEKPLITLDDSSIMCYISSKQNWMLYPSFIIKKIINK